MSNAFRQRKGAQEMDNDCSDDDDDVDDDADDADGKKKIHTILFAKR